MNNTPDGIYTIDNSQLVTGTNQQNNINHSVLNDTSNLGTFSVSP